MAFNVLDLIEYFEIPHDKIFVMPFKRGWSVPYRPFYSCTECSASISGEWNYDQVYIEGLPREHRHLARHIQWHKDLDSRV